MSSVILSPEDLINTILTKSGKNNNQLQKILENSLSSPPVALTHLEKLSTKKHALGLVYLLLNAKDKPYFVSYVERLVEDLNPADIASCVNRFGKLMHNYSAIMRDSQRHMQCLKTLHIAIRKVQINPEFLTPMHSDYLMICLKAKNFRLGGKLVDEKILDIDKSKTGITPRDALLYYFYAGNILVGLKRFKDAERFYETCLSVPAIILSAIMVEAFKRFVLVQLLNHGTFLGISKNSSNIIQNHIKSVCQIYIQFANAFSKNDLTLLQSIADNHTIEFSKDKNLGLITQCIDSYSRNNIQKLTSTYMTLSFSSLVQHAKLLNEEEVENLLLRMIENGEISAKINSKDKMVVFLEDQKQFNVSERVNAQIDRCLSLAAKLKEMDDSLVSSKIYISKKLGIPDDALRRDPRSVSQNKFFK